MTRRMLKGVFVSVAIAAALGVMAPRQATADVARIKSINYPGITVIGLDNGKLHYDLGGTRRTASISDVTRIQLDRYPTFDTAHQQIADGKPDEAAETLDRLYRKLDDGPMRTLVRARLIQTYDAAGRFDQAMDQFLDMIETDHGAHMMLIVPAAAPPDEAARSETVRRVEDRLAATTDLVARGALEMLLSRLRTAEPVPEPVAPAAPRPSPVDADPQTTSPATDDAEPDAATSADPAAPLVEGDDAIAQLLNAGAYQQVIDRTDVLLEQRDAPLSLSRYLYYRGIAEAELGRDTDALISLMRVVVHFRRSKPAGPCMIRASEILYEMGEYDVAERLLAQAGEQQGLSTTERDRIDKRLEQMRDGRPIE